MWEWEGLCSEAECYHVPRERERESFLPTATHTCIHLLFSNLEKCTYSYPSSTASYWHVSDLLYDVLGPVVYRLVDLDSCTWLCVKNEPVNTSRGFAVEDSVCACVREGVPRM